MSALRLSAVTATPVRGRVLPFDSAFLPHHDQNFALRYPPTLPSELSYWLAQQVFLHPLDLLLHVRRFYWHEDRLEVDALTGALVDLFLALGHRGRLLRMRFLKRAAGKVPDAWLRLLERHLEQGLSPTTPLPPLSWSRLRQTSDDLVDSLRLVRGTAGAAAVALSLLDEVRDLVDSGLLDVARERLEKALVSSPKNAALHYELIEIYRSTRDRARAQAQWNYLSPHLSAELAAAWHDLGKSLNF